MEAISFVQALSFLGGNCMARYGRVSVTATPTLIVAANNGRRALVLDNQQSTVDIYVGPDSNITTANTASIKAGTALVFDDRFIRTAIYGVTASGSASVGWWETVE